MNKIKRKIKLMLYSKHCIRNIHIASVIPYILVLYVFKEKFNLDNINKIINDDMFNISGILAGFIFTGLGIIISSNSQLIEELKITDNFKVIKNLYIYSILEFLYVILLYLLKPIVYNIFKDNYIYISIFYGTIVIYLFIVALILFILSIQIMSKTLE